MKKMYIVTLNYYDFYFEDRNTALDFADMAFEASKDSDRTIKISMVIEPQEEEKDENDTEEAESNE